MSGVAPTLSSLRPSPDAPRGSTLALHLSTHVALRKSQTLGLGVGGAPNLFLSSLLFTPDGSLASGVA